jgi:DNA-binding response OmpR family regulator
MPARKTTILVPDDDPQLLRLETRNRQLEGYEVVEAMDGQEALDAISTQTPDLVLLDLMMPRTDGFTVVQRVREFSALPIIIVTARGQEQDKIHGLDLGAADYLTKPFSVDELLARVRTVLRRSQLDAAGDGYGLRSAVTIGPLQVDYAQHRVSLQDQEVRLTPIEYRLLAELSQHVARAHAGSAPGTRLGSRIRRREPYAPGEHQSAAPQARRRSGTSPLHSDEDRHRLPHADGATAVTPSNGIGLQHLPAVATGR